MLDRTVAPKSGAINTPDLLQPNQLIFDNLSSVYMIQAGDQPVVKLEIVVRSGIWTEPQARLSWITAKLLTEGCQTKNSNQIAELFEYYGSFVEINPGFDSTSIVFYTPKKFFEPVTELMAEILFSPAFSTREIEILKTKKIQELRVNLEKNSFLATRKIRESLFGLDHPYGSALSIEDVELLGRESIVNYFESGFYQSPEFFLSGDVSETEFAILKKFFDLQLNNQPIAQNNFVQNDTIGDLFEEKEKSVQSSIRIGWLIPGKKNEDHFKLKITNELLGGYFSSRLMKNLREEKGYTYGVHSYPVFLRKGSFLIISTDVIAESTENSITEIQKEVELLKNEAVDAEELQTVKNYMAGSFLSDISSPFQIMDKFKSIHNHGLEYDYYDSFFHALKSTTPEDVMACANHFLETAKMHRAVVGKK